MITTAELVRQVRSQIQETNEKGSVTPETVLDALNRGLDFGWDVLARNYAAPVLARSEEYTLDSEGRLELPDGMFEDRLLKLDLELGGTTYEIEAISHRDVTSLSGSGMGGTPVAYTLMGRTIQVWPAKSAKGSKVRMWYLKEIPPIVEQLGRITSFTAADADNSANATIVLDNASKLSVSGDFAKYINFINFETGEIRGSAQVQSIDGNEVTLKLIPTRNTVLGQPVGNDIPLGLEIDDFVCNITGSCVMYFSKPLSNMVIQFAVSEIRRSLGYDVGVEERKLKELANQVNYTFSSRPNYKRVKRKNRVWRSKYYFNNGVY